MTAEEVKKINSKIASLIESNINSIMTSDTTDFYKGYSVVVSAERNFAQKIKYSPKTIYINVKFSKAYLNYGQTVLPANLEILSEQNCFDVAKTLISTLATEYNLKYDAEGTMLQHYGLPSNFNSFNEVGNGFRMLFSSDAAFLIAPESIPVSSIIYSWPDPDSETGTSSEIWQPLSFSWDLYIQLDSQAFYSTENITESIAKIGTYTVNFNMYQLEGHFFDVLRSIINKETERDDDENFNGIDTVYELTINFKDGRQPINGTFRLNRATSSQKIVDIPVVSCTFTF